MATIKVMAEKKYPIKITAGLGCSYDMNKLSRDGYIAGANAVLEEIEKCSSYEAFCQARRMEFIPNEHFWKLHQIREKIKELKGE